MAGRALAIALLLLSGAAFAGQPPPGKIDCADRFPPGRYGLSQTDEAIASGQLRADGFLPLYLNRQAVVPDGSKGCKWITPSDMFRLVYEPGPGLLVAGCAGDFDGDHRRDVALLMKPAGEGKVSTFAFLARADGFQAYPLGVAEDPHGFDEDGAIWPGPFCIPRPKDGSFTSEIEGRTVKVPGDLMEIGWYTWFWVPDTNRFDKLATAD